LPSLRTHHEKPGDCFVARRLLAMSAVFIHLLGKLPGSESDRGNSPVNKAVMPAPACCLQGQAPAGIPQHTAPLDPLSLERVSKSECVDIR